jgi:hypothetical protein
MGQGTGRALGVYTQATKRFRQSIDVMEHYTIRVTGHLAGKVLALFDGFTVTLLPTGETLLEGQVPDQAALLGTLRRIHDLGLTLVLVQRADAAAIPQ